MMAACRRQQGLAGFYKAFYTWSQLGSARHGRRFVATATPSQTQTQARPPSDPSPDASRQPLRRRPWTLRSKHVHALVANDGAALRRIEEQTGALILVGDTPRPGSGRHQIHLVGPDEAVSRCKALVTGLGETEPEVGTEARPQPDGVRISYHPNTRQSGSGPGVDVVRDQFRNIMRHTATNVAVLATDLLSASKPGLPRVFPKYANLRAVTVSSLTPVSLDPDPIVSFNIKAPSRTLDAILAARLLVATFLKPTPEGARIAHAFTQPSADPSAPFCQLTDAGLLEIHGNARSGPKLVGDAVSARLRCSVINYIKVADHLVVFARVSTAWTYGLEPVRETFLAYSRGGYRVLGEQELPLPDDDDEHAFNDSGEAVPANAEFIEPYSGSVEQFRVFQQRHAGAAAAEKPSRMPRAPGRT